MGEKGQGLEQSVPTWRKLGTGERGGWLGEQLAANLISSCDRAGQAWLGPTAGAEPGSARTSPPVTHDVFIKSKENVMTIRVAGGRDVSWRFLGGEGRAGLRSVGSLANLFSFSACPTHHSACV